MVKQGSQWNHFQGEKKLTCNINGGKKQINVKQVRASQGDEGGNVIIKSNRETKLPITMSSIKKKDDDYLELQSEWYLYIKENKDK